MSDTVSAPALRTIPVTFFDCIVGGIGVGIVAAVAFAAGVKFGTPAPVTLTKREYLTTQVWAPQCAPGFRGHSVAAVPAPPLSMDVYATAQWGDGTTTSRFTPNAEVARGKRTPYERARDAAEAKYYRDMFKGAK